MHFYVVFMPADTLADAHSSLYCFFALYRAPYGKSNHSTGSFLSTYRCYCLLSSVRVALDVDLPAEGALVPNAQSDDAILSRGRKGPQLLSIDVYLIRLILATYLRNCAYLSLLVLYSMVV